LARNAAIINTALTILAGDFCKSFKT